MSIRDWHYEPGEDERREAIDQRRAWAKFRRVDYSPQIEYEGEDKSSPPAHNGDEQKREHVREIYTK